ncbi:MAG: acyltransferase family protein [Acidimicrobiales bacterium]|nr:acyltransferase family protein [Acidimicrobiales bacterium]
MTVRVAEPVSPVPATAAGDGSNPARIPHVAAFDGLRGAAVAAVLLYHAGHLTGGWLGVDLFFVLSGYLITALLLSSWRSGGHVGLRRFWARRARRLAPALVITLVAVGAYATLVAGPTERLGIRWDGLATLFEVANWRTVASSGDYFARTLRPSPLQHTWSLSIEEQLYLLWPLAVAGVLRWRRRPEVVFVVAVIGAAASAALMVGLHLHGVTSSRLYYGTDTRASAVLLGAALAAGRVAMGPQAWARTRPARHVAGAVAALGLAVAWVLLDGNSALPYQGALPLAGLAGAVVVASVADRRHPGPVGIAASFAPLQALGRISYGVYLYHWPIYLVLDEDRTGISGWALTAVRIAVTIGLAAASYRFVEEPIRRGGALVGRQARAAFPAAVALAAIALFAGTLGAVRPPSVDQQRNDFVDRSSVPGAPLVLLAGDSVPLVLGVEMSTQKDELGISIANRASPGCHLLSADGPVRGVEGNVREDVADCNVDHRYRSVVDRLHPDLAMVMFGEFPNEAVRIDGQWSMPCQPRYLDALRHRLDLLIDDLRARHTPVVLVTAPGTSLSWVLERVKPGMPERVTCTNRVLDDIANSRPGVTVVDLEHFVCPSNEPCIEKADGADLRPDGLHFQGAGAAYVARWLMPRVIAAAQAG